MAKTENIRKDVIWIFVIGIGLLIYLLLNYITYGDPFKFLEVQSDHWRMNLSIPVNGFLFALTGIFRDDPGYSMTSGWFHVSSSFRARSYTVRPQLSFV